MTGKFLIAVGALLAALAIGTGAWSAHGLEGWLANSNLDNIPKRLANWETAVFYHMIHALGLMQVGCMGLQCRLSRLHAVAGVALLLGILLFSGLLYGWVLWDQSWMPQGVPLGGIAFIVGWILLAVSAIRLKVDEA